MKTANFHIWNVPSGAIKQAERTRELARLAREANGWDEFAPIVDVPTITEDKS